MCCVYRHTLSLYGSTGEAVPSLRVVAAGMGRSGSTWQFNAIIHILREAGIEPATKHGCALIVCVCVCVCVDHLVCTCMSGRRVREFMSWVWLVNVM